MNKQRVTNIAFKKEIFKRQWASFMNFSTAKQPPDRIINNIIALEQKHMFRNEMVVVYQTKNFNALYVSENVHKILGYSQEEFIKEGRHFNVVAEQENYYTNLAKYVKDSYEIRPDLKNALIKARGYYGGRIYKHKDGTPKQFVLRHEIHYGENLKVPEIDVMIFEEATHLFKVKDYWVLLQKYTDNDMFSRLYRTHDICENLITEREKEILILIANGKTSKEVASILEISPDTVGQHRKNMIKRTNAKDTSSLIQLCKICEII